MAVTIITKMLLYGPCVSRNTEADRTEEKTQRDLQVYGTLRETGDRDVPENALCGDTSCMGTRVYSR